MFRDMASKVADETDGWPLPLRILVVLAVVLAVIWAAGRK